MTSEAKLRETRKVPCGPLKTPTLGTQSADHEEAQTSLHGENPFRTLRLYEERGVWPVPSCSSFPLFPLNPPSV